jgi:hypothetical protein
MNFDIDTVVLLDFDQFGILHQEDTGTLYSNITKVAVPFLGWTTIGAQSVVLYFHQV